MSKSDMTDFQRTRSKVWFPSLDDDDYDDDIIGHVLQQQHRQHSWRRQPSSSPESRRVSSGSPSNGSHQSQDSGFSDSESGGGGGGSPPGPPNGVRLPGGVLPEKAAPDGTLLPSDIDRPRLEPPPCDCFLPACELSRKFRSYEHVTASVADDVASSPLFRLQPRDKPPAATTVDGPQQSPCTPNRTCFIVDELPKSGGSVGSAVAAAVLPPPPPQSTPGSTKSLDFDQSENVTVVENVGPREDRENAIIEPPTPFVDRLSQNEDDALDGCDRSAGAADVAVASPDDGGDESSCDELLDAPPEHTSTPKSTKNRCCTPSWLHYRKDLQLRKPKNLQKSFDRIERENEVPVGQWLNELRFRCESECMTTLQSKSIVTSDEYCRLSTMVYTNPDLVRELYQRTKAISDEFKKVYNELNKCRPDNFGPSVQTLTGLLMDFVCDHERELPEHGQELCMDLVDVSEKLRIHANRRLGNRKIVLNDVSALGQIFSELVDALLMKTIQSLVNILEEPSSDVELVKAMSNINCLGLESVHLGSLVTKCNGIRSLLAVCLDAVSSTVRSSALRTLAMVCCSSDSIRQFEKAGGVEILADILGNRNRSEKELTDAASVLAQITAPWIENNHVVNGLNEYLDSIISSLTYLVETTQSQETLLLSAAALANMTFVEPNAIWAILNMGTAGSLIEAVRKSGARASVFLQEQTATLLANMAVVPETRPHMAANHSVIALLCFLQVRHSPLQRVAEILAAERLQHKSAIALSRLCSDVEVSKQIVELEGVNRLIRLCKDERERNHSDGVLVACLASLRKISANCGSNIMNQYEAAELIEPRLLDSFLLFSSKQESYV